MDLASLSRAKRLLLALAVTVFGVALIVAAMHLTGTAPTVQTAGAPPDAEQLADLAESAAVMRATIDQATVLADTDRPAALAMADARAATAAFEAALDSGETDAELFEAGASVLSAANAAIDDLGSGRPDAATGISESQLDESYTAFAELAAERRRAARAPVVAESTDEVRSLWPALFGVMLVPALIVLVVARSATHRNRRDTDVSQVDLEPTSTDLGDLARDVAAEHAEFGVPIDVVADHLDVPYGVSLRRLVTEMVTAMRDAGAEKIAIVVASEPAAVTVAGTNCAPTPSTLRHFQSTEALRLIGLDVEVHHRRSGGMTLLTLELAAVEEVEGAPTRGISL